MNPIKQGSQKPFPPWLIVLAVLVTGGTTVWAMSQTGLRGPRTAWGQAQGAVDQVWNDPNGGVAPAAQAQQAAAWTNAPNPDPTQNAARQVAGLPGVPAILNGTQRPHSDRGPCVNCHSVLTGDNTPMPQIHSFSSMPHGFRGVCNNCHEITIGRGFTGFAVAATMPVPGGEQEGQQAMAMAQQQAMPQQAMMQQPMMQQPMMQQPMMQQPMMQQPMMQQPMMQQPMMQQPMMQQPMMQQPMMQQPVMQQPVMQQPMVQQQMMQQQMMQQQMMQQPTAAVRPPPTDAEWRGMELRTSPQGLLVTNAEGVAARSGLQPGDVLTSVNGAGVRDVPAFMEATQNGALRQGTVVVQRNGQRLAFELQPRVANNMAPQAAPMAQMAPMGAGTALTGQFPN